MSGTRRIVCALGDRRGLGEEKEEGLDQELAAKTAMVDTPNYKLRMQEIVARLRSFGLDPKVHTYYVYMSSPTRMHGAWHTT